MTTLEGLELIAAQQRLRPEKRELGIFIMRMEQVLLVAKLFALFGIRQPKSGKKVFAFISRQQAAQER